MLENLSKPVFTGSQLPIGDLRTDAKRKSDYSYPNRFFTRKKVQ
jgi:hypothetical protein